VTGAATVILAAGAGKDAAAAIHKDLSGEDPQSNEENILGQASQSAN
jgi:hypothetical protein